MRRDRPIRLPAVANAALDVLEARGIAPGDIIPLSDLQVTMDARGYHGRWVTRAVGLLVLAGRLGFASEGMIEVVSTEPVAEKERKRERRSGGMSRRNRFTVLG
jgi:hypothetical protein